MMMRTKVAYTLVAFTAVAAANPLSKQNSTSVAALEDNATNEALLLTNEPQCAGVIGVDPNDVEGSSGLEKRANLRDNLSKWNKHLSKKIQGSVDRWVLMQYYLRKPVPGTNIKIKESPRKFTISLMSDLGNKTAWERKIFFESFNRRDWRISGYQNYKYSEASNQATITCAEYEEYCFFH